MTILVNGSFEGGWTRKTLTGQEFGEIFVPEGWTAFWREGGLPIPWDPLNLIGYARPEMAVINKEAPYLDPPRIYDGTRAVKWFTFYKIHDTGILQQVETQPGQTLTLAGWPTCRRPTRSSRSGSGRRTRSMCRPTAPFTASCRMTTTSRTPSGGAGGTKG